MAESIDAVAARLSALEHAMRDVREDSKELRADIRSLTRAVADLSQTVALLSQRVGNISSPENMHPAVPVATGAAGGGVVAVTIEFLQRFLH
jgi:methyl-accepting chemotaxis protein